MSETTENTALAGRNNALVMPETDDVCITVPLVKLQEIVNDYLQYIMQPEVEYNEDQLIMANKIIADNKTMAHMAAGKIADIIG